MDEKVLFYVNCELWEFKPELAVSELGSNILGQDPSSLRDSGRNPAGAAPETRDGRPHCRSRESGPPGPAPSRGRPGPGGHLDTVLSRSGLPPARPLLATGGTAARPLPCAHPLGGLLLISVLMATPPAEAGLNSEVRPSSQAWL